MTELAEQNGHTIAAKAAPGYMQDAPDKTPPELCALSEAVPAADCVIRLFQSRRERVRLVRFCRARNLPVVIATTGHTPAEKQAIVEAAGDIPVFFWALSSGLQCWQIWRAARLRENRFPQASDADFIRERADHAAEVYEQARRDVLFADAAQELAMAALLKGLRFSKYSILYDVVDSEFPLEVAVEDQEAFVKNLLPLVDNVYSIYDLTDDDFAQSPDYDQLYTELTGAVALFIESNGVQ